MIRITPTVILPCTSGLVILSCTSGVILNFRYYHPKIIFRGAYRADGDLHASITSHVICRFSREYLNANSVASIIMNHLGLALKLLYAS